MVCFNYLDSFYPDFMKTVHCFLILNVLYCTLWECLKKKNGILHARDDFHFVLRGKSQQTERKNLTHEKKPNRGLCDGSVDAFRFDEPDHDRNRSG